MKKIIRNSFYLALLIISMFIISCAKKNDENAKKGENKKYNRIVVLDPATICLEQKIKSWELLIWSVQRCGLKKRSQNLRVWELL